MPFINRDFATLFLRFLLTPITKDMLTNLQNTVKRLGIILSGSVLLLIITAKFWSSYYRIRAKPNFGPKYGQHAKHCHRPVIHPFPLVFFCILCAQHFGVLTVKFLLNQNTTHMMDNLQNNVTRLRIIVLYYSYSAHHQNDTCELFP